MWSSKHSKPLQRRAYHRNHPLRKLVLLTLVTNIDKTRNFVSGGTQYDQPQGNREDSYQRAEVRTTFTNADTYEYATPDEAEAAFSKLLRRSGVQPDWTFAQTMRIAIKDPAWRAIKDPKDRKAAFDKYVSEVRTQEKDRERDRLAKLRTDFYTMFRSHPDIQYFTRWRTAKQIIEGETISKTARTEDEAKALFNEYRAGLYKTHVDHEAEMHKSALDKLSGLLASLNLEPYTRWSEAQTLIRKDPAFQGDVAFKSLTKIDILKTFENHIKALERTFNDKRQKQKSLRMRLERQNRDAFKELLQDLKAGGKLKAGTKWVDIHELIEDDPRYVAMLGQSGSTPLELFFDEVEIEEERLRSKRYEAMDVLEVSFHNNFRFVANFVRNADLK
jgi:pre-mRNA-processing factor 40